MEEFGKAQVIACRHCQDAQYIHVNYNKASEKAKKEQEILERKCGLGHARKVTKKAFTN